MMPVTITVDGSSKIIFDITTMASPSMTATLTDYSKVAVSNIELDINSGLLSANTSYCLAGNGKSDILFSNSTGTSLGYYADGSASNWVNVGGVAAGGEVVVA